MKWTSNGPRSNLESGLVPGGRSVGFKPHELISNLPHFEDETFAGDLEVEVLFSNLTNAVGNTIRTGKIMIVGSAYRQCPVIEGDQLLLCALGPAVTPTNSNCRESSEEEDCTDAVDLPPGTSPLSKLDLGPFEVHSMV